MRCGKVRKSLAAFADGELPPGRREEVAAHLKGCLACRAQLESIQKVDALSRQLTHTEPEQAYWATFLPRVRSKIAQTEQRPAWARMRDALARFFAPPALWPRLAGAVAAAVLVFMVGRAIIQREAHMGRVRALPKKWLTEQAHMATRDRLQEKAMELGESPSERPPQPEEGGHAEVPPGPGDQTGQKVGPNRVTPEPGRDPFQPAENALEGLEAQRENAGFRSRQAPAPAGRVTSALSGEAPSEDKVKVRIPRNSISATGKSFAELGRVSQDESSTIKVSDRGEGQRRAIAPEIESDRAADAEHWRQRIATCQEIIASSQRSDELQRAYSMLAHSWYQLALITGTRNDLLRAVEAQRAALDFTAQEAARRPFRERIEALEERLRKKIRE